MDRCPLGVCMTLVIAFDPGNTTGLAVWSEMGLAYSAQGTPEEMADVCIDGMEGHSVPLVVIEGVFVGPSAKSSLGLENQAGYIAGRLRQAGLTGEIIRPTAVVWRKGLGFTSKGRDALEAEARAHAAVHYGCLPAKNRTHEAEAICMADYGWGVAYDRHLLGY